MTTDALRARQQRTGIRGAVVVARAIG